MSSRVIDNSKNNASLIILVAAFAAVYVIWGSTYLAIKYAIETIPTFLMAGLRFLTAGTILYGISRLSPGYEKPKLVHWRTAFIIGTLLLVLGNGGVVLAEHYITSSLAALLVATEPFWIVLFSWMFMGKGRPNLKVTAGLALGFIGVWLLISGGNAGVAGGSNQIFGAGLVIIATLGWAAGSLYGTRAPSARSAILAAGMQMLAGGAILLVISTVTGEWSKFHVTQVSLVSWIALFYLIVFGGIVVFTAYSWLLRNTSPTKVMTYAYVNPAVAVVLGWVIAGESMTAKMLVGAGIIVGSVALITLQKKAATQVEKPVVHDSIGPAGIKEDYST